MVAISDSTGGFAETMRMVWVFVVHVVVSDDILLTHVRVALVQSWLLIIHLLKIRNQTFYELKLYSITLYSYAFYTMIVSYFITL